MIIGILGCGYVGVHLAAVLRKQGHRLHLSTTRSDKLASLQGLGEQVHQLRLDETAKLRAFLRPLEALFVTLAPLPGASYEQTYLASAQAISLALPSHGPNIRFVGYTSSSRVYGQHQGAWVDETSPLYPTDARSRCLIETEKVYSCAQTPARQVCLLRLGQIFGPGREIERHLQSQQLPAAGLFTYTNLVHVEDIAHALSFCLDRSLAGVWNLCCQTHLKRQELYAAICGHYGWPQPAWIKTEGGSERPNKRVSSAKIQASGYQFLHPHAYEWLAQV